MDVVPFPFRLVMQPAGDAVRPVCLDGRAVAFSSSEAASAFMAGRAGPWDLLLVGRAMLPTMVARLKEWEVCGLLLDPSEYSSGIAVGFDALGP